ncbi:hypothetical protein POTOM_003945 [Populus tomentosa]|uniref:Uncharacterized protein n=1 Tax=Populus tomentosa TaxID=118781 RepID=A0A8X8DCU9_POPTO|nr:hypothetical protein POTOM_003945 [Populus tomentosa]
MVVVLPLADGCGRRRWSQFMEAKRGAGFPVKTALLRLVAKESAVDGGGWPRVGWFGVDEGDLGVKVLDERKMGAVLVRWRPVCERVWRRGK